MAVYYFDFSLQNGFFRDDYGDAFDSLDEAVAQTKALLLELVRDYASKGGRDFTCELRDEEGRILYRATISLRSLDFPP